MHWRIEYETTSDLTLRPAKITQIQQEVTRQIAPSVSNEMSLTTLQIGLSAPNSLKHTHKV